MRASKDGTLTEGRAVGGSKSFTGDPTGFLSPNTANATFTSAPFTADTVLIGLPKLTLATAVTLGPLNLITTLYSGHDSDKLPLFTIDPSSRSSRAARMGRTSSFRSPRGRCTG